MVDTIVLVKDADDIESLPDEILHNCDIFSFNIEAHKILELKKIHHFIAEEFLSAKERQQTFDIVSNFHQWYKNKKELESLHYDGINILGLMDTIEFHTHLMNEFINFFTIKNIIKEKNPKKIISTEKFSEILKTLISKNEIPYEILESSGSEKLYWEDIQIKQNIGNIPISLNVSRTKCIST